MGARDCEQPAVQTGECGVCPAAIAHTVLFAARVSTNRTCRLRRLRVQQRPCRQVGGRSESSQAEAEEDGGESVCVENEVTDIQFVHCM